jgi:hypothetical protein
MHCRYYGGMVSTQNMLLPSTAQHWVDSCKVGVKIKCSLVLSIYNAEYKMCSKQCADFDQYWQHRWIQDYQGALPCRFNSGVRQTSIIVDIFMWVVLTRPLKVSWAIMMKNLTFRSRYHDLIKTNSQLCRLWCMDFTHNLFCFTLQQKKLMAAACRTWKLQWFIKCG